MWIKNGTRTELINSSEIQRFCVVRKDNASLLIASVSMDTNPITVARYHTHEEAMEALDELGDALEYAYAVRESTGRNIYSRPVAGYHGNKTKTHGGS